MFVSRDMQFFKEDFSQNLLLPDIEDVPNYKSTFARAPEIKDFSSQICNDEIRGHIPTLPEQLIPSPAIPTFAVNPIVPIPPIMTSTAANLVPDSSLAPDHSMATRGKARLRKLNPKYALHISTDTGIPSGIGRALEDQDWYAAMKTEYQALMANQTWELVCRSPEQNVLSSK